MGTNFPGDSTEVLGLLKTLNKDEILGILSESEEFCCHCLPKMKTRIQKYIADKKVKAPELNSTTQEVSEDFWSSNSSSLASLSIKSNSPANTLPVHSQNSGWANLATQREYANVSQPPVSVLSKPSPTQNLSSQVNISNDGHLLEDPNEFSRIANIGRKKNFSYIERVHGAKINVLKGLELHTGVFNAEEQKKIVDCVYDLQRMGKRGQLRERTYLEPKKWIRGKGRVTIQFGCCYNYAKDKYGNPPGISRDDEVDPLPPLFKQMIKRMVKWHVLPSTCVPDSCIVNIYDAGDCIPPHIDHHDFLRPFCTVSFLSECKILFGTSLKVIDEGEFEGPVSVPLPLGSVLILSGNGADVAKHCVPAVPAKRISITFRKMDPSKIPYNFLPDSDLAGIKPLVHSPSTKLPMGQHQHNDKIPAHPETIRVASMSKAGPVFYKEDDFPALGSLSSSKRR